jgi:hypothetical protein
MVTGRFNFHANPPRASCLDDDRLSIFIQFYFRSNIDTEDFDVRKRPVNTSPHQLGRAVQASLALLQPGPVERRVRDQDQY